MPSDATIERPAPPSQVQLTIDGMPVSVPQGTTIFDAARAHGIPIPTLCHQQNETPVGVCRVCVVDIGQRVYAAACIRQAESGMAVKTNTEPVLGVRKTLVELLMSDHPSPCARQQQSADCELERLALQAGLGQPRFPTRTTPRGTDDSSLAIQVDHEACILCDRCIRGCDDIRDNWVLARRGKGYQAGIAFDNNLPMGESSCVSCGECMVSCPTGALTNRAVVKSHLEGETVDPTFLTGLPVFENVSGTFLGLNRNAIVERRFKAGEIICREGEFGATAFYIVDGAAEVYLASPIAHVKTEGGARGFLSKLTSLLTARDEDERSEESTQSYIPIDASVDLPYQSPIAELGPGELFGEMTCMSYYPRSATVRAKTDCTMLEMLRNVLDIMQRNKTFREQLDRTYKKRALDSHLRSVPVLAPLTADFIDHLREHVELLRFQPGQIICSQGELADSFYLVRLGFVKVSQHRPGGDFVLAYLARGSYFGEMAFLTGTPRMATCTALDHVEVVRIRGDDFQLMLDRFPDIRQKLETESAEHVEQNRQRDAQVADVSMDQFLSQGLMEAQSLLILDLDRCTRCDQCVRACADAHDGVSRLIREGLRFDRYLVATSCRQCRDPLCMVGCPVGSIRRRNSLEVIIEDWCIGCGQCANNCPYGNINMHPFPVEIDDLLHPGRTIASVKVKATSCDLCLDHEEPSCVYACPHDAAHRVNPPEFFGGLLKRQKLSKQ
ncbi:MAG TPA: cyclic nucleotide-binding domain-containing protein [Terriglobales bacterium]|jgi:CRP-like cAMP-binding protein/Fe-S-cluster-containing hydrogenase component 2|nr:cyclic nucleotide-binding domain-containing protein [Terriglobales bacterium]